MGGTYRKKRSRTLFCAALLAGTVFSFTGSAVQAESEEGQQAMGRFTGTQLTLPELPAGAMAYDIVCTDSGQLRIVTAGNGSRVTLWDSGDGGQTWTESSQLPEECSDLYYMSMELCGDGGGAGVALVGDTNYYVSFDASGNAEILEGTPVGMLAAAKDGKMAAMSYGGEVFVLDRTTGEQAMSLGDVGADAVGICGDEVLAVTSSEVLRCNVETGEPLARDEALEQALFDEGETYDIRTSFGRQILFGADEEGRLYYCTGKGIFSHMMGGSVVEQIVDDGMTLLSDPAVQLMAMEVSDGIFYILALDGEGKSTLLQFSYSEDIQSVPPNTVTVYSLDENQEVRHAAAQFQQEHPDIYIDYQVGVSRTDGMTVDDALRTLNTQILAGDGPDVLILDGMPVDDYIEKGVLADLGAVADAVGSTDGLIENVAYAYERDGSVYAVPIQFGIVAAAGEPELVTQLGSTEKGDDPLDGLCAQEGMFAWSTGAMAPEFFYPLYAAQWQKEDGTLDEAAIRRYVEACSAVYQNITAGADEEFLELLQLYHDNEEQFLQETTYYDDFAISQAAFDLLCGDCRLTVGVLGDMMDYMRILAVGAETGSCTAGLVSEEGIFVPYVTVGMLRTAKSPEQSQEFVKYLLSENGVPGSAYSRFPVNKKLFEKLLLPSDEEKENMKSIAGGADLYGNEYQLTCEWPSDQELDAFREMVGGLSVCANMDSVQREQIIRETKQCMYGACTEDEAVNSIMQKLNLYLAE